MPFAQFVESRFIPNHVELKGPAGRIHYHAILKHVLTPELVDRLFARYHGEVNGRLKALSGWPYLDHVGMGDVTADHIRRLTKSASAHGYSPQTVKHIRNVISAVFNHARKERVFIGDNPVSEVDLPPAPHKNRPGLSMVEANAILNLLESPEREVALLTMMTGLKISEICALQWKHINLGRSRSYVDGIHIPPGVIFVKKYWSGSEIVDFEAAKARGITVSTSFFRHLLSLRQAHKVSSSESFLIAAEDGGPLAPSRIRTHRLKPIARQLGLPWLSWQALRQTYQSGMQELTLRWQVSFEPADVGTD